MRILLKVAYDGSEYHGWQYQEGIDTVEGQIQSALYKLIGQEVKITGASRTDAGVHALGNVAVFDSESGIPPEKYSYALNNILPSDIRIMESKSVDFDFNPRFEAKNKTYEYHIYNDVVLLPTRRLYAYHYNGILNIDEMNAAAKILLGEHDFSSFASVHAQTDNYVRTIYSCYVEAVGKEVIITVNGNGFLYNMVRIIAGSLLEVGRGKLKSSEIQTIMDQMDRTKGGPTLPPEGLVLKEINY